jgi:hypothetical protein
MPKRSSSDLNQTAARIVAQSTYQSLPVINPQPEKNPAAVALGRLGGLKGGKARAESLSAKRKVQIARNAAISRWKRRTI